MSYAKDMPEQDLLDRGALDAEVSGLASVLRIGVTRLARRMRSERSSEGLTVSQLSVLGIIEREGPLSPTQLAAAERVQPPSMTRVVGALEELGLLHREPHPTDRRQCVLALTESGRDLLAEDRNRRQAWLACRAERAPGLRARGAPPGCSHHRKARGFVNRTFASLRIRNYRLFASGQLVSLTGTWMQRVGQDWLVLRLSDNSGTAIGITTALQFLPILLLGLQGGVIADRFSKRKLLLATQATMGLIALGLGLLDLLGAATLYDVYLFAFLLGVVTAVDNPTRQAFVSELVGGGELPNAVSLNSATFNAARIVGPAAAGLLIDGVGTAWVFLGNAASFLAVITCLLMMRPSELFPAPRLARQRGSLREGLSYVRRRRELLVPIVLVGVVGTFGINFQITLALLDKVVFGRGAGSFGLLSALLATGALAGALLSARRTRPTTRLVVLAAIAFGVLEALAGLMPTFAVLAIALLPVGFANITFSTAANSSVQLASAPEMRGRVMGLYMLVFVGGTPLGAPLVGWISQELGARWGLILGGIVSAGAGLFVLVLSLRREAARSHELPSSELPGRRDRCGLRERSGPASGPVPAPVSAR